MILCVTTLAEFNKHARILNYESRGGALQRHLGLDHFRILLGATGAKFPVVYQPLVAHA